jgi:hypothetical protein
VLNMPAGRKELVKQAIFQLEIIYLLIFAE